MLVWFDLPQTSDDLARCKFSQIGC